MLSPQTQAPHRDADQRAACVPTGEESEMMLYGAPPRSSLPGIWRPPELTSSAFARWAVMMSSALIPNVMALAMDR